VSPATPSGAFSPPPPEAPYEIAQPLTAALVAEQLARAAQNERTLAPLVVPMGPPGDVGLPATAVGAGVPSTPPVAAAPPAPPAVPSAPTPITSSRLRRVARRPAPTGSDDGLGQSPTVAVPQSLPETRLPPPLPHQPAASDTDTPSRGMPQTAHLPPGKQITGGFGDAQEARYYPLDGIELRRVVERLIADLHQQIQNDLRFSLAVTYPRVTARVDLTVEGWAADQRFVIPRVAAPHDTTPVEIARARSDEICFVVRAAHVEMTAEGESVTPPNQVRQELGLPLPRKQRVEGGGLVDVLTGSVQAVGGGGR
jgi:hypothetical protein